MAICSFLSRDHKPQSLCILLVVAVGTAGLSCSGSVHIWGGTVCSWTVFMYNFAAAAKTKSVWCPLGIHTLEKCHLVLKKCMKKCYLQKIHTGIILGLCF